MVFLCGQYYIGYLCLYLPIYRRKVENKIFSLPSDTSFLSFPAIVFHFLFFPFSLTESSKSVLNARFSQIFQISSLPPRKLLLSLYQHFFLPPERSMALTFRRPQPSCFVISLSCAFAKICSLKRLSRSDRRACKSNQGRDDKDDSLRQGGLWCDNKMFSRFLSH